MQLMIKPAYFAGTFYPQDYSELSKLIESFNLEEPVEPKEKALGMLLPHAAYVYSGKVAYKTLISYNLPDVIVILGTHHQLEGAAFAASQAEGWQTPLGVAEIDIDFTKNLINKSQYIEEDESAFKNEHSIEVQIPLLQYIKKDFQFVPILISETKRENYKQIASDIIDTAKELKRDIAVIASGDLTHYEPQTQAEYKDKLAIEAICRLDADKLLDLRDELNISMCAGAPAYTMLCCSQLLKANKGKLILYETSGAATDNFRAVVGYGGIGIS
jgi:hypothetical protein